MERQRIRLDNGIWFAIDDDTVSVGYERISMNAIIKDIAVMSPSTTNDCFQISFSSLGVCGTVELSDKDLERLEPLLKQAGVAFYD